MALSLVLRLVTTLWLVVMIYHDLRQRELPHWGTTVPLVGLGCYSTIDAMLPGQAANSLIIGLSFLAVLLSDHWLAALPPAIGALAVSWLQGTVAGQTIVVAWLVALALAKVDVIGAGDAKVVMILTTLYPEPKMALHVALGAAVISGLWLLLKQKENALASLWLTLHTKTTGTRAPGVPLFGFGALIYIWLGGL
jgi:Flp pilus assembly protein protease CpaA